MKEMETNKRQLEEEIDKLNEEAAKLRAQGEEDYTVVAYSKLTMEEKTYMALSKPLS